MPGKHVLDPAHSNDHLPLPLTSRNLRPRLATTALGRASGAAYHRTPLNLQVENVESFALLGSQHPSMASSSDMTDTNMQSNEEQPAAGPSGTIKRRRSRRLIGRRMSSESPWVSGLEEEEFDQLISDNEQQLVPSLSMGSTSQAAFPSLSPAKTHQTKAEPERSQSPSSMPFASTSTLDKPQAPLPRAPPVSTGSPEAEPLSAYTCPICFFPPTNATITPCGHICCGACLFTAVRTTMQRAANMAGDANVARCPVCRADIPDWDGRGGGVIGLKPRAVFSL